MTTGGNSHPDFDQWSGDEPDPIGDGRGGISYRCIEPGCGWTGRGGAKAFDHHRSTPHHQIVNKAGHQQIFGCCQQGMQTIEREQELFAEGLFA